MSKPTELARAEADRAEAESPDDEPAEPEPEGEPGEIVLPTGEPATDEEGEAAEADEHDEQSEPASALALPPDSLTVSEELGKKRDKQRAAQVENLVKLADEYGQDVMPCPVCENAELAGLLVARISSVPAEAWPQIPVMFGVEVEPEHAEAEGVVMCDRCNGWGELDYPTRNPHMARQTCPACAGNGYVPEQQADQPPTPVFTFPAPQVPSGEWGVPPPSADQWGRPPGHPHYGLDPAAVMP